MPRPSRSPAGGAEDWPGVSVIVLGTDVDAARAMVDGLLEDPYPGPFEILLAAPPQEALAAAREDPLDVLADADDRVAVIHGQDRSPAALVNAAAFAASRPILSIAVATPGGWTGRLRQAVDAMEVTGADVVGGAAVSVGLGSAEAAIARAINSRLGVGPRPSRTGGDRGPTDSVRMVTIRRDAFERAGGLDRAFLGAQDWEFQHRVRESGGMVWLDPSLALGTRAPSTVGELAELFYRTAAWRRRIVSSHTDATAWSHLAPPTLVGALVASVLGAVVGGLMGVTWMWWLGLAPVVYGLAMALGAAVAGTGLRLGGRVRFWWAVIVIQLSWGAGFFVGRPEGRRDRPPSP